MGISVPISLAGVPGGPLVQALAGTPILYYAVKCHVRLCKKTRVIQTSEVDIGYTQKPDWRNGEGVTIDRRTSGVILCLGCPRWFEW
jgi:hypothetical protein